jgi:segregation and condensation protein B
LFPVEEDENSVAPQSANDSGKEPAKSRSRSRALKEVPAVDPETGERTAAMIEAIRIAEAMVFAAEGPIDEGDIAKRIPEGLKIADVMQEVRADYQNRGVNLIRVGRKWTFRTAADLGWLLSRETQQQKKLSRAALETLAIIAYHQPVTRAEIEDIRGVAISKGTLDVLMETGWVRLRGRRKAPGRPVTYGTTDEFLLHFGLEGITDLPGLDELKGAGLFDGRLPPGFGVPTPNDSAELAEDEDPLEEGDLLAFSEDVPQIDPEAGADVISEQDVEAKDVEARLQQAAEVSPELADSAELEDDAEQEPADTPEASEPGAALAAEGEVAHDSGHVAVESLDESASEQRESIEDVAEAIDSAAFEEPSAAASDLENSPAAAPEAESGDPDRKD